MDPALALFLTTVVAWIVLELSLILQGKATVSARVQRLYQSYPSIGVLAALVVGLLVAHFFWH